ncbi:MAG: GGDEF domain-containing protein [Desulfosudaceae bacterium]
MDFKRYKINRRVLEDIEQRATPGMYFYLIITALILLFNQFYQRHLEFSVIFAVAMTLIAAFRLTQFYLFRHIYRLSKKFSYQAFFLSVYATALLWGTGAAYFMLHPEEAPSQMIMLTATAGLAAGGSVAFFPAWHVSVLYVLCMLGPVIISMFLLKTNMMLAFLIMLYAIYLPIISFRGNREYWNALENEHLLKVKSEEIEKLSRTDGLTGLYNRRYFDEMFTRQWKAAVRNAIPISLIIGDIDFFKQVNDTYGHPAGDEFLQEIAALLGSIMKRETDIIARYGGEEFLVLTLNSDARETREQAETIREKIEKMRLTYQNQSLQTTISLGAVSCVPGKNDTKESFLKKADDALYRAKEAGRNQVVFQKIESLSGSSGESSETTGYAGISVDRSEK